MAPAGGSQARSANGSKSSPGAVLHHHAGGFVYRESGTTPSEVALGRWAHEIVPAVRQAITQG